MQSTKHKASFLTIKFSSLFKVHKHVRLGLNPKATLKKDESLETYTSSDWCSSCQIPV